MGRLTAFSARLRMARQSDAYRRRSRYLVQTRLR